MCILSFRSGCQYTGTEKLDPLFMFQGFLREIILFVYFINLSHQSEKLEDAKRVTRSVIRRKTDNIITKRKTDNIITKRKTDNIITKRKKQTMLDKMLRRKLKIE